jgi:alpha-tubulin suppressor-like RCC1 family protein
MILTIRDHSLFVRGDGRLLVCGSNGAGQLGVAGASAVPTPRLVCLAMELAPLLTTQVETLPSHGVIAMATSACHTAVALADGLYTCGTNTGQLGFDTARQETFRLVRAVAP